MNYEIIKLLGSGMFGSVYKALDKNGKVIALKVIDLSTKPVIKLHNEIKNIENEVEKLKSLSKPNCNPFVVCYYDSFYDYKKKKYYIEMEYLDGMEMNHWMGDLNIFLTYYGYKNNEKIMNYFKISKYTNPFRTPDYLDNDVEIKYKSDLDDFEKNKNIIKYKYLLLIAKDLATGLNYIHSKNIFHNDIKLQNILVENKTNIPKIIDFGFACTKDVDENYCENQKGTPYYTAPEIYSDKDKFKKTAKTDMWALGVALYKVITGKFPYDAKNLTIFKEIVKNTKHKPIEITNKLLEKIVNGLLNRNPLYRMESKQVMELLTDESIKESLLKEAMNNYKMFVDLIQNKNYDPSINNNVLIKYASSNGLYKIVEFLLSYDSVDPSVDENYALKHAIMNKHEKIVNLLVKDKRVIEEKVKNILELSGVKNYKNKNKNYKNINEFN